MMRILLLLMILSSLPVMALAQDDDGTPPPPPPPRSVELMAPATMPPPAKSTLRARVYYEDSGRPVKRTSVILMGKSPGEFSGITDANGNLEIRGVRAGKYFALISAPGVLTPFSQVDIRQLRGAFEEEFFDGVPAIEVDGITDVVTEIPARRGAAIGGRVTYADGSPAIGVSVEVLRKVGDEFLPNMSAFMSVLTGGGLGGLRTDDRGVYRFSGLPAGEYIVKVTEAVSHTKEKRPSYRYDLELIGGVGSLVSNFFENALTPDKADIIAVQLGQEMSEINIVIPDRDLHAIEGKLVAAKDKLPIRGAKLTIKRVGDENVVSLVGAMGSDRFEQAASTDEKGGWKFTELPKGTYRITAEPGSSEFDEKDRAYGNDPNDDAAALANANRAVAIAMNAAARGGRGPEKPATPKFAKTFKEFTIDDDDLSEQLIELNYGATIIGTVTFEEAATEERGSVTITTTNEKGGIGSRESIWFGDYGSGKLKYLNSKDFRLEAIPSGRSTVSVTISGDEGYVKSAASNQIDLLKGPVEFKEGDVFANVRIVISNKMGTLRGTVADEDKQPVVGAELVFMPVDPSKFRNSTYYRSVKSRSNGEFEVKLPPFEYALVLSAPPSVGNVDDYYKWLEEAVKKAQTFNIEAGKTITTTIKWAAKVPPGR